MVRVDLERNRPVRMLNVLHARRGAMPYLEHAVRVGCGEYPLNARRKHQPGDGSEQEEHAHAARVVARGEGRPSAGGEVRSEKRGTVAAPQPQENLADRVDRGSIDLRSHKALTPF